MRPDWSRLDPHKPLDPGADAYEPALGGVADEIARWVLAGRSAILVGGPAGVGKSTELAQVAQRLQADRVACLVPLDRWENMRRLTPDQLLRRIAGRLVYLAVEGLGLPVSDDLRAMLVHAGLLPGKLIGQTSVAPMLGPGSDVARMALNEVSRLSKQGRVTLILDGLEKVGESTHARDLFDALQILVEKADIVTVVPWHTAFGPQAAEPLLRSGERFVAVRAPEVDGTQGEAGRAFLLRLLARRLDLSPEVFAPGPSAARVAAAHDGAPVPAAMVQIVAEAAALSGGLPRTFLQLLADAGTYARLRRDGAWPSLEDLADAVADQQDSLRRILLPGDRALLRRSDGTDGIELETGVKVRMLAHGLLLERPQNGGAVLRVHPLVAPLLSGGADA